MLVLQIAQLIALLTCKYEIFAHILYIYQFTFQAKFQVRLSSTTYSHLAPLILPLLQIKVQKPWGILSVKILHYLKLLLVLCHLLTY